MMSAMRTPLLLALIFMVAACSAESAPDNAAGSVKQVSSDENVLESEEAKKKKKKKNKDPQPEPHVCNIVEQTCADSSQQKWCVCNGQRYPCGCLSDSTGGAEPLIKEPL
jgi:hypothetical protein